MKKFISLSLLIALTSICVNGQSNIKIRKNASGATMIEVPNNAENTLIGNDAGLNLDLGLTFPNSIGNTFIGRFAGKQCISGYQNTFIGKNAGQNNNGFSNTMIGSQAGDMNTGSSNVFLGYDAGHQNISGHNNIFLGKSSGYFETGSNKLYIENTSGGSMDALIYGDFMADSLRINAATEIYTDIKAATGLYVNKNHVGNSNIPAIEGVNDVTDNHGIGVRGTGGKIGVDGQSIGSGSGVYSGVNGESNGTNNGHNYGVKGFAENGDTNYGVYGSTSTGTNNYAGYFEGKVTITDTVYIEALTKLDSQGIQFIDTDIGSGMFDDDEIIKRTTPLRYFIAVEGIFPVADDPISNDVMLGEIKLFPYNFAPGGWLPCEGQLLPVGSYFSLFSLLGVSYGGNGISTFGIPDMRNAVPNHN